MPENEPEPGQSAGDAGSYREAVYAALSDEANFLQLILTQPRRRGHGRPVKVVARPVLVGAGRQIQFATSDGRREVHRNVDAPALRAALEAALDLGFQRVHVQSRVGNLHVKVTRKGRALVSRGAPSQAGSEPLPGHDRIKRQPLAPGTADLFLHEVGIMNAQGDVRPSMWPKFRQINEFLRILDAVLLDAAAAAAGGAPAPLRMVDCGCGSAWLTFAAYHYANHVRGVPAQVTGIDLNEDIAHKCVELRDRLGWGGLEFRCGRIADFAPDVAPDAVLSLHACDTATDEAIAQGIRWGARAILAAPCCQHELHRGLDAAPLRAVLKHGLLRERLADIVTDAFRAQILRAMGYRACVLEFVSPEHTSKNLMIRAEAGRPAGEPDALREYLALKAFWGVTPCLETLLAGRFPPSPA